MSTCVIDKTTIIQFAREGKNVMCAVSQKTVITNRGYCRLGIKKALPPVNTDDRALFLLSFSIVWLWNAERVIQTEQWKG